MATVNLDDIELTASRRIFDACDLNGDGFIDPDEFHALLLVLDGVPDAEGLLALHEPGLPGPWDPTVLKEKAERYLEHLAKELRNKGIATNSIVISHGRADEVIASTAKSFNDTLIALATHGRGGLAKVVWGSVADKVIRNSAHPTLIFRPV